MIVPEPSPDPEPELPLFVEPPPPPPQKRTAPPPKPTSEEDDDPLFLSGAPKLDSEPNLPPITPKPPPAPPPPLPVAPPRPVSGSRKVVGIAVDVAILLLLLVGGVLLGEKLAQKSTQEVIQGINGPKFPQLELLMWLAPPVVFLLIYLLLGSRGKTLGAWLRKRGA